MSGRLHRSKTNRVLGGVCGGLGEYLGLDANIIRLFFVLLALGDGIGGVLYLLLWILLPAEAEGEVELGTRISESASEMGDRAREFGSEISRTTTRPTPALFRWVGITMMALGVFYLLRNLDLIWLAWLDFDLLWPVLLIIAGIVVILRRGESHVV
jgi:phage shock protein C